MDMPIHVWLLSALFIILGGFTKGVVGLGMPLVCVPLLSFVMPTRSAVILMAIPMLLTNAFQLVGGHQVDRVLYRMWPLLLTLIMGILLGAYFLTSLDSDTLGFVVGTVVLASSLAGLVAGDRVLRRSTERLASPFVGLGAGLLGGIAGLWGGPAGMYLAALDMTKEEFIASSGAMLGIGSVAFLVSLVIYGAWSPSEFLISCFAVVPAFVGLLIGQVVRHRLPHRHFRRAVLVILAMTGALLVYRSILVD